MIKKRPASASCYFYVKIRKRPITTSTLPVQEPPPLPSPISTLPSSHKSLCLSLVDQLLRRGRLSSAQHVIQRVIIGSSTTVPDAISAVDFAAARGMDLDVRTYGDLVRKVLDSGQLKLAHALYSDYIVARGVEPDSNIINSMVICLVKLGKLEDAVILFDRLFANDCVPCKAACTAILKEYFGQERFLEAFDCFVRINDANVQLGLWCYNVLIDGLCYKGCVGEAMEVFDIMCQRNGVSPTLHLFKSLFYGLCKRGWAVEAESIFEEMEAHGFYVDKMMYTSLINCYCKDKKMKMAMRVYMRMLKTGCQLDNYTYNTLIHGFFKMGLFDKGWILYNHMIESGMLPNMISYHLMISCYCKEGKMDCASLLLNNMVRHNLAPTVHCYTVLMAALYKENRFMEADELVNNMMDSGVVPDHVLFFILMKNSPKGREVQLSLLLLQAIAKIGCGLDPSVLSGFANKNPTMHLEEEIELLLGEIVRRNFSLANVAAGIYISALCEGGKTDAALACLGKMVNDGCNPLLSTFNSLIKRLCQDGLFEDVKSLIYIMQKWAIIPDLATYLILVYEYCKQRDVVSAFDVLDQMEERGLKPSVAIYDCIIGCLSREKRMFEAETLFQRMLEAGVDPDEIVYMTMINAYSRNGRALEALQLFEMMIENAIQPSSYSYTALISGLVRRNMTKKGCIYLDRMLGDGFAPNAVFYTSLIAQFLRKGELEFAFRLVDLMDRNQIEADLILYIVLVSGVCRNITGINKRWCKVNKTSKRAREMLLSLLHQGTFLPRENILRVSARSTEEIKFLALKLMQKIEGTGFMPNLYLYNGIIAGFCLANRIQDAYNQLDQMLREGVRPNEVTFTILIDAHSRAGEIDCAMKLFNKMNADGCVPDKITYDTLLKGLCKAGRELDVLSLLYAMRKRGFFPSKASYENLLHYFCARYLSIPAFRIFEEMLALNYVPRRYGVSWLLCLLYEEKKFREAHMVFVMMLERGKFPVKLAMRFMAKTSYKQRELEFISQG